MANSYSDKLKDPRWQKRRLEIMERDKWMCRYCYTQNSMLSVHHIIYHKGKEPWEYSDKLLITLCDSCHKQETNDRPEYEQLLIDILATKFGLAGLVQIIDGFCKLKFVDDPFIVASVLQFIMSNNEMQEQLLKEYYVAACRKADNSNPYKFRDFLTLLQETPNVRTPNT